MDTTRSRKAWIAVAALGMLATLAVIAWQGSAGDGTRDRSESTTGNTPPAVAGEHGPADEPGAGGRVERTPVPTGPLPAVGTPLRLALDELERRARAGDPEAMCRLAAEHAECQRIRGALASASLMLEIEQARMRSDDGRDRSRRRERVAERGEKLLEEAQHCDGVPPVTERELVRQWRAAAHAGSLPALEHYALGNAFPQGSLLSVLPELATYRAEAEALARRAAEAGSQQAILMLGLAYMPDAREGGYSPLLLQAVEPDRVQAMAMLRVVQLGGGGVSANPEMRHMFAARLAQLEARMTPEEQALAVRRAEEISERVHARSAGPTPTGGLVESCSAATATGQP